MSVDFKGLQFSNFEMEGSILLKLKDKGMEEVVIPEGVTIIAEQAFSDCEFLTKVKIPKTVTSIERRAFSGCSKLSTVEIPESVTEIGVNIFHNSSSVHVYGAVGSTIECYCQRRKIAFSPMESKNLRDAVQGENIKVSIPPRPERNKGKNENIKVTIPLRPEKKKQDTVFSLDWDAAWMHEDYSHLTLQWSYDDIILEDDSVTHVVLPSDVVDAIYLTVKCKNLQAIIIPEGVNVITSDTFYACPSLKWVRLPNSVRKIESGAFSNCKELETINIPEYLLRIDENAFEGCRSLSSPLIFPKSLKFVGQGAFQHCTSLTSVQVLSSDTGIAKNAFEGCKSLKTPIKTSEYDDFIIQEGVLLKYLGQEEHVVIPSGVEKIGNLAINDTLMNPNVGSFFQKDEMISITFPDTVNVIGEAAFEQCSSLSEIYGLEYVQRVEKGAFENCNNLETVTFTNLMQLENGAFSGSGIRSAYISGTLLRVGSGAFASNIFATSYLERVVLGDTIELIGRSAFAGCSFLEDVTLPKSLRILEKCAFINCTKLREITIPSGIEIVESNVFDNCSSLKTVTILSMDVRLEDDIFENTSSSLVVEGFAGSTVEHYCKEAGISFRTVDYVAPPERKESHESSKMQENTSESSNTHTMNFDLSSLMAELLESLVNLENTDESESSEEMEEESEFLASIFDASGKIDGTFALASLLGGDIYWFTPNQINFSQGHHYITGIDLNLAVALQYPDIVSNAGVIGPGIVDCMNYVEQNEKLMCKKGLMSQEILEYIRNDDLTGITLMELFVRNLIKLGKKDSQTFHVIVDTRVINGIPNANELISELLRTLNRYNGLSDNISITLATMRNLDV